MKKTVWTMKINCISFQFLIGSANCRLILPLPFNLICSFKQGMDDMVVPPSMTDYVHRILPGAAVHKLPYEGHFTYIYFCDECHRQIFTTLFGTPQGQLNNSCLVDQTSFDCHTEDLEAQTVGDSTTD